MNKIMSGFLALCLVAAVSAGAQAKDNDKGRHHGNGMGMRMSHQCAPGKSWVKGYKNKYGKHVKGYCR